jgi:hypothetical protein
MARILSAPRSCSWSCPHSRREKISHEPLTFQIQHFGGFRGGSPPAAHFSGGPPRGRSPLARRPAADRQTLPPAAWPWRHVRRFARKLEARSPAALLPDRSGTAGLPSAAYLHAASSLRMPSNISVASFPAWALTFPAWPLTARSRPGFGDRAPGKPPAGRPPGRLRLERNPRPCPSPSAGLLSRIPSKRSSVRPWCRPAGDAFPGVSG